MTRAHARHGPQSLATRPNNESRSTHDRRRPPKTNAVRASHPDRIVLAEILFAHSTHEAWVSRFAYLHSEESGRSLRLANSP